MATKDNTGRFHFDPEYDASRAPSLGDFMSWLEDLTEDDVKDGLPRAARTASMMDDQRSYVVRLMTSVLGIGRGRRRSAERACVAWAEPEIRRILELAREFGVDFRNHELSDVVKRMVTIVIYDRAIERAARRMPGEGMTVPDTEKGLASSWTAIRSQMENEALVNIMESGCLKHDRLRTIAALRACQDEMTDPAMRARIAEVVEHVERSMSQGS